MMAEESDRLSQWTVDYCVKPCAVACFFVLVALLWTFLLQHVIAYPFVFLFFGAIMGSAWFGGFIAGFISIFLSSVLVDYCFIPPLFSFSVGKESQSFLTSFILCSIAITVVSSARKRSEVAVRNARDQLETRVQERTADLLHSNLEIQARERQLRILTEAIPQQIWRTDPSGRIEYCNHHLCDYTGLSAEELQGETYFSIFHPEDEWFFRESWQSALTSEGSLEVEARVRGADANFRWFLIRSHPQRTKEGQIACWYGIHIDIEDQYQAQQKLIVAQENLARLSRTQSMAELAASIAHELNQPLTAVVTQAYACREWLNRTPANIEKATATAERIVQESTRASAVVSRVRALFRQEAQEREPVDINKLISELARLLRDESIRRNVSIRLQLSRDIPIIPMDAVQIQQVLVNLAFNGMDAMASTTGPRELTIRSEVQGENEILVSVQDCGAGVDPAIKSRIFDAFYSTKPHGTGMGLAICRSIIEEHDGRLSVDNAPHGGAIFRFTVRSRT